MLTLAVPVYNMSAYLPRCMKALLNQTCLDFEIILIDDGSTDESGQMCDAYATEHPDRIRVIHKENGGLSSARNVGIAAAHGEFIVFPDPDDWVEPDYVETFLRYCSQQNMDLVCTGYYIATDLNSSPGTKNMPTMSFSGQEAQKALLLPPQMHGFAWNKLYRLDIIRKNNLQFLSDTGTTEDLDFTYRYLSFCKFACFIPAERTYHYYQRDGAATRSGFSQHKLNSLHTYEKIINDCADSIPALAQAAKDDLCTTAVNLIWLYQNSNFVDPHTKRILLRHIRKNLPSYLQTRRYGTGRKLQAVLAGYCPALYALLKNTVHN